MGNPAIIAIGQDSLGVAATRIANASGLEVLTWPLANGDRAVAVLSTGASRATISTTLTKTERWPRSAASSVSVLAPARSRAGPCLKSARARAAPSKPSRELRPAPCAIPPRACASTRRMLVPHRVPASFCGTATAQPISSGCVDRSLRPARTGRDFVRKPPSRERLQFPYAVVAVSATESRGVRVTPRRARLPLRRQDAREKATEAAAMPPNRRWRMMRAWTGSRAAVFASCSRWRQVPLSQGAGPSFGLSRGARPSRGSARPGLPGPRSRPRGRVAE